MFVDISNNLMLCYFSDNIKSTEIKQKAKSIATLSETIKNKCQMENAACGVVFCTAMEFCSWSQVPSGLQDFLKLEFHFLCKSLLQNELYVITTGVAKPALGNGHILLSPSYKEPQPSYKEPQLKTFICSLSFCDIIILFGTTCKSNTV